MAQTASNLTNPAVTNEIAPRRLDLTNLALLLLACVLIIALLVDLNTLQPGAGTSAQASGTTNQTISTTAQPTPIQQFSNQGDY